MLHLDAINLESAARPRSTARSPSRSKRQPWSKERASRVDLPILAPFRYPDRTGRLAAASTLGLTLAPRRAIVKAPTSLSWASGSVAISAASRPSTSMRRSGDVKTAASARRQRDPHRLPTGYNNHRTPWLLPSMAPPTDFNVDLDFDLDVAGEAIKPLELDGRRNSGVYDQEVVIGLEQPERRVRWRAAPPCQAVDVPPDRRCHSTLGSRFPPR